jgi:hypothetical protein
MLILGSTKLAIGQCVVSNPLTTGNPTNISTLAQSFTTSASCVNQKISDITIWSTGSHNNVTLKIYNGDGCGTAIHTQAGISIGANGLPTPTTIDVVPDLAITPGNTYTFQLKFQGGSSLLKSIVNIYSGGSYRTNPNCNPTNQDLFFIVYMTAAAPLPVELKDFQARPMDGQSLLTWQTASELNNAGFEVERSGDGKQWEALGFVNGHGTTAEPNDYRYLDAQPLPGINYYRLRQIDYDGNEEELLIRALNFEGNTTIIKVSPNPASAGQALTIVGTGNEPVLVVLSDIYGRPVWNSTMPENGELSTTLSNDLPSGVYSLVLFSEGRKTCKLLRVN